MNKNTNSINNFFCGIDDSFLWSINKEREKEVVFYSDNILKLTGYTSGEIDRFPGKFSAVIYDDDLQRVKKMFTDFSNDASINSVRLIYRIVKKDKSIAWIKESISADRDESGKLKEIRGIVSDITDLMDDQDALAKSLESFKQLNSSKDKFISILSHDLRAPFTSILGFSEILINEPNLSHEERLEYLNYINDSSQHQLQLVNYLLDWSRLQTGRLKIEPQRLHVQSIIFNCISSLTGNAIRKKLEIKLHVKESLYVQADERLLSQVVTNLLSNAIKFSPEGMKIEISADSFNDKFVEFIVKDEGLGISDSNKAKLFRIEKMFSTEGTKGEKGTGLGLSLVKEIIEKHEGEIWFYSEQNKGSEFHFTLPSSPNTILLVENNYAEKEKFENILRENFPVYKVVGVRNGYDAINHFLSQLPSLIISDYDLPLMNGVQFVESIRKEDKGTRIPIIAIVPEATAEIKREFQIFGVDSILQKPIDDNTFSEKVQAVLDYH